MIAVRLVLAGLITAVGIVFVSPATSYACSCVMAQVPEQAQWADTVFTGTLTDIELPPERRIMSSGDPVDYTFAVDTVHQGDAPESAVVTSAVSGASCGLEGLEVDRAYVVFATGNPDRFEANLCGGTAPASADLLDEVDKVLGPGHPPSGSEPEDHPYDQYSGFIALILSLLGWS